MEQARLFDDKPYIRHYYLFPNVVELKPVPTENPGHDYAFDCEIIDFPEPPEDRAA
jgi:hypothetical protein